MPTTRPVSARQPLRAARAIRQDDPDLDEAVFHYEEAQRIAKLAVANYESHVAIYPQDSEVYSVHIADVALRAQMAEAGALRLTGIRDWLMAKEPGKPIDAARLDAARRNLHAAQSVYRQVIPRIAAYMATEFRYEALDRSDAYSGRRPFEELADQAQRASDQIDRMVR